MGEAVEERGGHLGVAEDGRPFADGEFGGDDDGGLLIEPADQVDEELPSGLGKRQVAELMMQEVGDDPVGVMVRQVFALFDEYQSKEIRKYVLRSMRENAPGVLERIDPAARLSSGHRRAARHQGQEAPRHRSGRGGDGESDLPSI